MNAEFLRTRLMEGLQRHPGRGNAIPRDKLLADLKCWDPSFDDRRFRDLYAGLPVCTCAEGMFLPRTPEEVEEFKAYLTKGWGPNLADRRVKVIMAYYPNLAASTMKQQELGYDQIHGPDPPHLDEYARADALGRQAEDATGFRLGLRAALGDIDLTPAPLIESLKPGKRRVSITIYRPRRLDPDNCAGGLKPLLDAMRDIGLIRNDSPRWLELVVDQRIEKIDCRTEIILEEMP